MMSKQEVIETRPENRSPSADITHALYTTESTHIDTSPQHHSLFYGILGRIVVQRLFVALIVTLSTSSSLAVDGVTETEIVFGQSCAMEGPTSALGLSMREGILAAFDEINDSEVLDKKIRLKSYDDGYEPEFALKNTITLIEEDKVFALAGYVGTPTTRECLPVILKAKIPLVGPLTGANFLRKHSYTNIINLRASYAQETETWIDYLTSELGLTRIAIFFQDDSFGRSGLSGVRAALQKRDLRLAARGTYARNLTAVHSALFTIRRANPEAIVMVGAYRPCAEFIRLAKTLDFNDQFDPIYVNISFVGAQALANQLNDLAENVIVSQVVPLPWDSSQPLVRNYQKAMRKLDQNAEFGFVSLEGYLTGRFIGAALQQVEGQLTRESFLASIYGPDVLVVDGFELKFGEEDNQGSDLVYLTQLGSDLSFDLIKTLNVSLDDDSPKQP
jgi:branched-chain amino acid transport system substrate-binding protein